MHDQLEHIRNLFKSADEKTWDDFNSALVNSLLPSEQKNICESLLNGSAHFVTDLRGENGFPILLENETAMRIVMKTYSPSVDFVSEAIIEHRDRLDLLREEVAAFFVSAYFPLVHVPATVLRPLSQDQAKEWHVPQTYSSDSPNSPSLPTVAMFQQFIENAQTYTAVREPLTNIASPRDVFGLLIFDYLVAYGDGRFSNLLVKADTLWAVDHGGSFRLQGTIRGTESMGIGDDFQLNEDEIASLRKDLNPEKIKSAVIVLEKMLGKKKAFAFNGRFTKIATLLANRKSLTIRELKQGVLSN